MALTDRNIVNNVKRYGSWSFMIWVPAFAGMGGDLFGSNDFD